MDLSQGRPYLAIPGPSVMPEAVLRAMHRSAPNIYEGELVEMTYGLLPDLKWVAGTAHDVAIYIANGHATWEASLANVVAPGDKVLVPASGRFGHGWSDTALGLGVQTEVIDFGRQSPIDPARVAEALAADRDHAIKAVLAVHVDTSTSARSDIVALRRWCQDDAGLTLGIGLGMETESDPGSDGFFRFGHMGHVNAQMILGLLATVQTGMVAQGIPHGPGGIEAAAKVIAGA